MKQIFAFLLPLHLTSITLAFEQKYSPCWNPVPLCHNNENDYSLHIQPPAEMCHIAEQCVTSANTQICSVGDADMHTTAMHRTPTEPSALHCSITASLHCLTESQHHRSLLTASLHHCPSVSAHHCISA